MRKEFAEKIIEVATKEKDLVFLTADLGYMTLEKVKETLQDRFINMGVAEQSMVSSAAGLAHEGFKVIAYSIAPFIVYRPLEQIRNDVCFHNKSVFIVGNGGGYGYGIMGSSHHCIEDIAVLSCLPNMTCYVPAFIEDLYLSIDQIFEKSTPAYLRLGLGKPNPFKENKQSLDPTLLINETAKLTIVGSGPVLNNLIEVLDVNPALKTQIDLFRIVEFPVNELDENILQSIHKTNRLLIIEEHVSVGGLGQQISVQVLKNELEIKRFKHLYALGYPDGLYGDQKFHQKQSGLDAENIFKTIQDLIND